MAVVVAVQCLLHWNISSIGFLCDSIREGVDTYCLFAGIGFPASICCCVGVSTFAPVGELGVLLWIMTLCVCG